MMRSEQGFIKARVAGEVRIPIRKVMSEPREYYVTPDGRKIRVMDNEVIVEVGDEKRMYPHVDGLVYSKTQRLNPVPLEFAYPVRGCIIPEEQIVLLDVNWSVGNMTFYMNEKDSYVSINTLAVLEKLRKDKYLKLSYIIKYVTSVEKEYFDRDDIEKMFERVVEVI